PGNSIAFVEKLKGNERNDDEVTFTRSSSSRNKRCSASPCGRKPGGRNQGQGQRRGNQIGGKHRCLRGHDSRQEVRSAVAACTDRSGQDVFQSPRHGRASRDHGGLPQQRSGWHNVYWPSISGNKKLSHNLGTWPKGEKKSFQFSDLGVASLLCNVHPEMNGYVVVVTTPYFAVTDKSGSYEIKNVPPGKYTLKTWSENGKPTTQAVEVTASGATADLTVKK